MKRLLVLPNNLGDVIMASPIFESLKRHNPTDELHFLVESGYEGGVLHNPNIDKIHLFPRKEAVSNLKSSLFFSSESEKLSRFIETLKSEHFDQIINFSQHTLYASLVSLIGAKEVVGMHTIGEGIDAVDGFWSRFLFGVPFSRRYNVLHAIDTYKFIAGVPGDMSIPQIFLLKDEKESALRWLTEHGFEQQAPMVVFQPGAAFSSKMWGVERFVELGRMLIADGNQIVITGAPSEELLCRDIAEQLGEEVIVSAGKTSFRESIAITSFAQSVVTGDTALMHAAAALKIQVFALFGPTSPVETGPYGEGHVIFVTDQCDDRPCFKHSCDKGSCLQSISANDVYRAMIGGEGHFKTTIVNGLYHLQSVLRAEDLYANRAGAKRLLALLTTEVNAIDFSEQERADLTELERRLSLAMMSLSHFFQGDRTAYDRYSDHVEKIQDSEGIAAFLAAMINIGLNSISIVQKENALQDMFQVLALIQRRLSQVL